MNFVPGAGASCVVYSDAGSGDAVYLNLEPTFVLAANGPEAAVNEVNENVGK